MQRGTFIVLEGIDGSGKTTQLSLLGKRLERANYTVEYVDFPQYSSGSSYFIKEYLSGVYGSPDAVGPYTASLFYALDRYEASAHIREALAAGKVVLANRFTGSNMGHQGTKFRHPEERRGFFIWLDNLEFQMLGIPRPDINFVLRVPAAIALQQIETRAAEDPARRPDLHEADAEHLAKTVEVYDDLCQLFPKDFTRVDCLRDDKLLSIADVANILWGKVEPLLPEAPQPLAAAPIVPATPQEGKAAFYMPEKLDPTIRQKYVMAMAELREIRERLRAILPANSDESAAALQAVLPLATLGQAGKPLLELSVKTSSVKGLADAHLPANHTAQSEFVRLASYAPRNELDLAPEMLYEFSDQPLAEIQRVVSNWSYDQKATVINAYIQHHQSALAKATYSWDVVSDFRTVQAIEQHLGIIVDKQAVSPRLGYDIPDIIEQFGLSDDFERCFDLSLELYSQLQAAGYSAEAQYAVLAGHRLRWKAVLNHSQLMQLAGQLPTNSTVRTIIDQAAEVHPLFAEALKLSAPSEPSPSLSAAS